MTKIKRAIFKMIPLCLLLAFFLPFNSLKANAADYPAAFFFEDDAYENLTVLTTAEVGETVTFRIEWFVAFNNEGYDIVIYDPNGYAVASASKTFTNDSALRFFTLTWDTTGMQSGYYKAILTKNFYSYYSWHSAPEDTILYIHLLDKPNAAATNTNTSTNANTTKNTSTNTTTNTTKDTSANTTKTSSGTEDKSKAKAKASVINKATVKASDIKKASKLGCTSVTLGPKVKKISPKAFKNTKITKVIVKTKKLKAKTVKNAFKGSKVKTIKVSVGNKAANKKYVKTYKKIFTKKNVGKKVSVKR